MKRTLLTLWFLSVVALSPAFAGERSLGQVWIADGGSTSNLYPNDGGLFTFATPVKLTLQCTQDVYVCSEKCTCTATTGVKVLAGTLFPTSVDTWTVCKTEPIADGGVTSTGSGVVSVVPVSAAANVCTYFNRRGTE